MESERVQEALEDIHHHEHSPGDGHVGEPHDEGQEGDGPQVLVGSICARPGSGQAEGEEDLSELGVSQGQRPQSQVGGGV